MLSKKMKKYIPILIFISTTTLFLCLQIINSKLGLHAGLLPEKDKKTLLYTNAFSNKVLQSSIHLKNKNLLNSKYIIINFWASWCIPCLEEMPTLITLQKKYKDILVIYVNIDSKKEIKKLKKILTKLSIPKDQIVYDSNLKISNIFKIQTVPYSIIYKNKKAISFFYQATDFTSGEIISKFNFKKK